MSDDETEAQPGRGSKRLTMDQLDAWIDRVLDAKSLTAVFGKV